MAGPVPWSGSLAANAGAACAASVSLPRAVSDVFPLCSFAFDEPFAVPTEIENTAEKVAAALSRALRRLVDIRLSERRSPDDTVHRILTIPDRVLTVLKEKHNEDRRLGKAYRIGSFRPDILLLDDGVGSARLPDFHQQETDRPRRAPSEVTFPFQICEINARFGVNGYLLSHAADRAVAAAMQTVEAAADVDGTESAVTGQTTKLAGNRHVAGILQAVFGTFNFASENTLFLIKGVEPGWDIRLIESVLSDLFGSDDCSLSLVPKVFHVEPSDLATGEDGMLYARVSSSQQHMLPVINAVLELHQNEIEVLTDSLLRGLARIPNLINDLRTIYCIHDKRVLALLSDPRVLHDVCSPADGRLLEASIVSSAVVSELRSHPQNFEMLYESRHKWLIKPNLLGKGKGIIFGRNISAIDWRSVLADSAHSNWIIQPAITQPRYPVLASATTQAMTVVGMILCWNEQFLGLGIWRGSPVADFVSVSGGGKILLPVIRSVVRTRSVSHEKPEQATALLLPGSVGVPTGIAEVTPDELLKIARRHPFYSSYLEHYAPETCSFNDVPIMSKDMLRDLLTRSRGLGLWSESVYISPSGGTGGQSMFVPCDVAENKYQRLRLAERMSSVGGFWVHGRIYINLFSGLRLYRSLEIFQDYGEMSGCTILPIGFQVDDQEIIEVIQEFSSEAHASGKGFGIVASPTRALQFAVTVAGAGLSRKFPIKELVYAAEPLHRQKREEICRAFGADLELRAVYGSAEAGVFAFTNVHTDADFQLSDDTNVAETYFYDPQMMHVEVVPAAVDHARNAVADATNMVQATPAVGRLVVTPLMRSRFPLLRFDTGDIVLQLERDTRFADMARFKLLGRDSSTGTFLLGHGFFVADPLIAALLSAGIGIIEVQLLLSNKDGRDSITACCISTGQSLDREAALLILQKQLHEQQPTDTGYDVSVEIVAPAQLVRAPVSQKFVRVVDQRDA